MAKRIIGEAPWFRDAAELMVRKGQKLLYAAHELDIPLEPPEAEAIATSKSFQRVLWQARNEHYREVMADPDAGKGAVIGRLMVCGQALMEDGNWKEAAEVLLKLSKVAGYTEPDVNVNVIGDLTQKDIEDIKRNIAAKQKQGTPTANPN